MSAGRLADRHGYHRPLYMAVALEVAGGVCAILSSLLAGSIAYAVLCLAAALTGAGANFGLIVIQRAAGRMAHDATELKRIFSWLGLAPALSNVVGPVLAGTLIDLGGFLLAFVVLSILPLLSIIWARRVPIEARDVASLQAPRRSSWKLLEAPGFARLLIVNWLLS